MDKMWTIVKTAKESLKKDCCDVVNGKCLDAKVNFQQVRNVMAKLDKGKLDLEDYKLLKYILMDVSLKFKAKLASTGGNDDKLAFGWEFDKHTKLIPKEG